MGIETNILVVDDDPQIRKTVCEILTIKGYAPIAAANGRTALDTIREQIPDAALIDLKLGDMSGLEVMKEIKKLSPGTECIVLTGYASQESAIEAVNLGAYSYVQKPYDMEQLLVTIRRAIEKREADKSLRESEERFRQLVENANDIIYTHDLEGNFTSVNPAATRVYGYSAEELLHLNIAHVVAPDYLSLALQKLQEKLEGTPHTTPYELLTHSKGGEPIWVEVSTRLLKRNGQPAEVLGIARDITKRRQVEEELRKSHEQLRSLARHQESIREEERTRIARELHDEMGQALTALKMDLSWLVKNLPRELESPLRKVDSMAKLIDTTIQTVKRISTELRPGILDDIGLSAAIEWQAEEFQNRTGIRCEITLDTVDVSLDPLLSTAIFRIFQETLTNVARHAQATKVKASLRKRAGELVLKVIDDGKGITKRQISDPKSFGLIGMMERTHSMGGEMQIRGVPNNGTTVKVSIPLHEKRGA